MMKPLSWLFLTAAWITGVPGLAQWSPFIHVDQFGYRTTAYKTGVLSEPLEGFNSAGSYAPGPVIEVRDLNDDTVVFSGTPTPWNNGELHAQSGDRGWWFDFTAFQDPGRYYLFDPTHGQRSPAFDIKENPYRAVLRTAGRMFYYNRSGIAKEEKFAGPEWTDGPAFLQDTVCRALSAPLDTILWRDLAGGWFDAGDYNKYVTFAAEAVHHLLWAWEENPQAFGDDWNIPESGNGLPDLLDELIWELDWLYKMSNADGSVHIKMGTIAWGENDQSPPSSNQFPSYYGPTCSSASIAAAGMLAHAAWVFGQIPQTQSLAEKWLERAEACFAFAAPLIAGGLAETDCDDGTIKAGDADWDEERQHNMAVNASVYLLRATGASAYADFFRDQVLHVPSVQQGWWDCYNLPLADAVILYLSRPEADPLLRDSLRHNLELASLNNWGQFFGYTEEDLYRAFMPDWSYHWGSNYQKANYALLNLRYDRGGIAAWDSLSFRYKAEEQLHYFHGVNPLGLVYLSNMYAQGASRSVNEIYHSWFNDGTDWDHALQSPSGPPPGYLSGGPNGLFSVPTLSPPAGQPLQKSYLDFNTGWPENSWEISEPAIYSQAGYVRLLANYVLEEQPAGIHRDRSTFLAAIRLHPNPAVDWLRREGPASAAEGRIIDARGRQIAHWPAGALEFTARGLPNGWYQVAWPEGVARFLVQR